MSDSQIDSNSSHPSAAELAHFVAEVRARLGGKRPNLGPNQVEVSPGGKTFPTIGAALASISDASQKKQYVCYIGPGTYTELVVCKPWVFLQGEGQDQTTIAAPPSTELHARATVVAASNSAIQSLAVTATSAGSQGFTVAVAINAASNFDIEGCALTADDKYGAFTWALVIDLGSFGSGRGSAVNIAYTQILGRTTTQQNTIGMTLSGGSLVQVTQSKIVSASQSGTGAQSTGNSQLVLYNSYVEGAGFALAIPDEISICIANQCQIKGPVAPGVVVNP